MRRGKRISALFLCMILMLSFSGNTEAAEKSLLDFWNEKTEGNSGRDEAGNQYNTTVQLTEADILRMNDGDADFIYSEDGYLTFLRGKYYEGKVTDPETGIESLFGIADLLGLSKGSEFFAVFGERDTRGYTYFTYKQRYGDLTLENAVLKIIVDPEGYTAGVVSSFTPNVGIAEKEESAITAEEAEKIVQEAYPEYELRVYSEHTRQTSVTIMGVAYHAWAVFTNAPQEASPIESFGYLEHLVAYDGSYLTYLAVSSPEELVLGDDAQQAEALSAFDGLVPETVSKTVILHDGTKKTITVPLARDPASGIRYVADLERHIMLADYYSFDYLGEFVPMVWDENNREQDPYLLAYESYRKVYDFFKCYGLESVDGFGAPILILTDYCDSKGEPENNACYMGMYRGWAIFAASSVNDFGECVDVSAHEFTHGVTTNTIGGNLYENASGAVNEGLSDIMGNLCEMLLGETEDTSWLIAENSGTAVRCLSSPSDFGQPTQIDGYYYLEETEQPSMDNDYGGVHRNSSLISHTAWKLCSEGMPLEEAFYLWREAVSMLTPKSGYQEVHEALIFTAKIRNMEERWITMIDEICRNAGY